MLKQKATAAARVFILSLSTLIFLFPSFASAQNIYQQLQTPFYDNTSSAESCSSGSDASTGSTSTGGLDLNSIASKYGLQSAEVKQLGGAVAGSYNADQPPSTPASTMKLIIADTALRSGLDLSKTVSVSSDVYYDGSNDLGAGQTTLQNALIQMLSKSSNVGANVLMKAMGGVDSFTQKAQSYGYTHTTVKGYYDPSNDGKNTSTISDEVAAMDHIFGQQGSGYGTAQQALQQAAQSDNQYGVTDDANKWAGTSTVAGNVAKLKAGGQDYIIGVYINQSDSDAGAIAAIKNSTADIANALTSGGQAPSASTNSASCCNTASDGTDVGQDSSTASQAWNSGLNPPYIVEQFAINVLGDLAQKKGVDQSNTVTSQHVLALVAWAIMEGGDINNSDLFNLYNTSQADSDLGAVKQSTGNMAYPSFNQGVEATARTLDDGNHNGMLKVLLDSNSSAADFAHAESYSGTSSYPGTLEWAGAANADPASYENNWQQVIQTVKSNYSSYAAIEIGTPAHEQAENLSDPSLLSNINSGGFAGSTVGSSCTGGVSAIVQEALALSWPDNSHGTTPTPAYQAAYNQYDSGGAGVADCGSFVATVMHASGADKNYPASGTSAQEAYVRAHPELYDVVDSVSSISDLQPGDILIVNQGSGEGAEGHTYIFVGTQPPNGYNEASASLGDRAANLGMAVLSDDRGNYLRARLK